MTTRAPPGAIAFEADRLGTSWSSYSTTQGKREEGIRIRSIRSLDCAATGEERLGVPLRCIGFKSRRMPPRFDFFEELSTGHPVAKRFTVVASKLPTSVC